MLDHRLFALSLFVAPISLSGCVGLGSERLALDRDTYTERLRDSEKVQLLANIVALRFDDAPTFLSVSSVISQYTRETSGRLALTVRPPSGDSLGEVDGNVLFRETPTTTYTPVTGDRFARSLLAPFSPASLIGMVEAGWAADELFNIAVRSINGVRNVGRAPLFEQAGDPRFPGVLAAFRRLQRSGALSVRIQPQEKGFNSTAHISATLTDQDRADLAVLTRDLGLRGTGGTLKLIFASDAINADELAISTRSMLEVLQELSQGVDMTGEGQFEPGSLIQIHSGEKPSPGAHVASRRAGRWYWIAGDDRASRRTFLFTQIMMSLNDDSGSKGGPLITVPAG